METTSSHIKKLDTLSEVQNLVEVFTLAFEQKYTVTDEYLTNMLNDDKTLMLGLYRNNDIVGGLVAFEMMAIHGTKELYIYDIAVHPEHQKQGFGRALMEHLKKEAKKMNVQMIFVEAESEDKGAVGFYRSLGGEEVSVNHFNFKVT